MQKATPLQRLRLHNSSYSSSYLKRRTDKVTVFIKREDKNVTGSHKDRGIWSLIDFYWKKRKKHFVISSSGNAAVSAAYYCKQYGLRLDVFVGEKIPKSKWMKVRRCESEQVKIHMTAFPRRDAFRFAKESGAQLISTSTDDHCLDGYAKIVKELPKDIDTIFVPASSGALAVGIYNGYKKRRKEKKKKRKGNVPQFFVCQTPRVHPLINLPSRLSVGESTPLLRKEGIETNVLPLRRGDERGVSIADAISDVIGERRSRVQNIIKKTKGAGIIVDDQYIKQAMKIVKKELKIAKPSPNGSLAFAGLLKLSEDSGMFKGKKVVCLYTGL